MELLKIRTEQFEGPLDLMLFLIQKNELDINEISIHKITDQYVQYCEIIRELNFDMAAEFLLMAATLIHLKSKRLLPDDTVNLAAGPDAEIPLTEEELVRRLVEYKRYQEVAKQLAVMPRLGETVFTRPNVPPVEKQTVWKEMDITNLTLVFQDALRRQRKRTKIIIREPTSIPERISQPSKILKVGEMTEFAKVMPEEADRSIVIVTFIALLEIARLKKLRVFQNETFGTIFLTLTDSLDEMDPTLFSGFQYKAKSVIENSAQENTPKETPIHG